GFYNQAAFLKMDTRWLTRERLAWVVLALFVGGTRLSALNMPLSNEEAASALTALALLRGEPAAAFNPLLSTAQAALFALFGASDIAARLPGALAGVALCFLPLLLRSALGAARALLMGALLALSPALWFVAQNAAGASLAWALALFALVLAQRAAWSAAGAAIGVLMACGYDAVLPALAALLILAVRGYARQLETTAFGTAAGIGLLLASTGLGWRWQGIGDAFDGYARWGAALSDLLMMERGRLLAGFALDEILLWGIGSIGVLSLVVGQKIDTLSADGLAWLALGVAVAALFPQPANLLLVVLSLSLFGSGALHHLGEQIASEAESRALTLSAALVVLLALSFGALGLRQYGSGQISGLFSAVIALAAILGVFAFGGLWMAFGAVSRGIALATVVALAGYALWAGLRQTVVRPANAMEAYRAETLQPGLSALRHTLRVISLRDTGEPFALSLNLPDNAPNALRWALREWTTTDERQAAAFLTPSGSMPTTRTPLIGHTFEILRQSSLGELSCGASAVCLPVARWAAFREGGTARVERWTLWVRSNIALRASGYR
ncbi:MAG: glycosyltransferase family 39 protein, partial [Thermoflexales bacterium]|nr:glycosyltransferase family 39 protein [Thermoflexales bacterium]